MSQDLNLKPIGSRKELVERMIAAFGRPDNVNKSEMVWSVGDCSGMGRKGK